MPDTARYDRQFSGCLGDEVGGVRLVRARLAVSKGTPWLVSWAMIPEQRSIRDP